MSYQLINASAHDTGLPAKSVHCVVTSPPYFGLRNYAGEQDVNWPAVEYAPMAGLPSITIQPMRCGLGAEPTPEAFIGHLILVMREMWRILRDDGTCFVNLADSYSSGVGANLVDCFNPIQKGDMLFFRNALSIGIATHSINVSLKDKRLPDRKLFSLLGVKRITLKQRNNNFCQVINLFATPRYAWISAPIASMSRDASNLEIVIDEGYSISIIISNMDANSKPIFGIPFAASAVEKKNASFTIKETAEPVAETIADGQAIGNPISFNSTLERIPDINLVNESIPFADGFDASVGRFSDFRVIKATQEQFTLQSKRFGIDIYSGVVGHDFYLLNNNNGLLEPYSQLYTKAISLSNGRKAKQEMSVPEMFKQACQAEGWICRNTLIWHKPNPMPESVTDRCTKAHEYIYMLAKSEKYYFDADAISEASEHLNLVGKSQKVSYHDESAMRNDGNRVVIRSATRNKRSVWKIATQPYAGSHFATFPIELPLTCIKAGTSEHGVCAKCQAPYERVTEKTMPPLRKVKTNGPVGGHGLLGGNRFDEPIVTVTTGWQPTCTCNAGEAIPATVLDPFSGSATSGRAAMQLNRSYIGLDICQSYLEDLAPARMSNVQIEMALA